MVILNNIQTKLHHLAQFLGAFGNCYLPKEADDSHTAMKWDIGESALRSAKVNNTYLELSYKDIMLRLKNSNTVYELDLLGVDEAIITNWIKENVADFNLNADDYSNNLGYLKDDFDGFIAIDNYEEKAILTAIEHRNIAQKCLQDIAVNSSYTTSEIRVWPHGFDTGMLIAKGTNKDFGNTIGCGYAIADSVYETPYFYAYAYSNTNTISYKKLTDLTVGTWHITENWNGIILPANFVDNVTTVTVTNFYNEAIYALSKLL